MPSRPCVKHTIDFDRIAGLPRRVPDLLDAEACAAHFTESLCIEGSGYRIRPWQGFALWEALENNGAWLALPVGVGKTLISYTLALVFEAKRPLLIVPASLREKTYKDFAAYRGKVRGLWHPFRVVSREELALEQNERLLELYNPDLIVIDEGDELANPDSAAVRRIDRFILAHRDVPVIVESGTPSRKSIMNYWHTLCWCLKEAAPVPMRSSEAKMWAAALDESKRSRRPDPGPLGETLGEAREWYRRRLLETPGVVVIDGDSCDAPLTITTILAKEDPLLDKAFERLLVDQVNPGGIEITDPLSMWLLDGQQGCGLYTRYIKPPPAPWREANRAKAKFVRDAIDASTHSDRPLDTEMQVLKRYKHHPIVEKWTAVKDTFDPVTEAVWISTSTIESALAWLRESKEPSIIWTGSVDFGRALARAAKLTYYGQLGKADGGQYIQDAPPSRSFVASWAANKKGFNLQSWRRILIVMPPQSAKWIEQIIGRSHRSGQDRHVNVYFLLTSGGTIDAFEAAINEARFARKTVSLTQKILRAKIVRATPRITASNEFRWATRSKDDKEHENGRRKIQQAFSTSNASSNRRQTIGERLRASKAAA